MSQQWQPGDPRQVPQRQAAPPRAAPGQQVPAAAPANRGSARAKLGCLLLLFTPAVLITWFVVASGSGQSPAPAISYAPPVDDSGPASAPFALGPLTLAGFPSTADGRLARGICGQWAGLRQEYASRASADSPYQLNGWLSGPDWHKAWSDGNDLGDDPAYPDLETALGVVMTGDMAGAPAARAMDQACAAGD